jgi:hypothetical protein
MGITLDRVRGIFKGLESGNGTAFFEHVADNVDWIAEGTHPPAGRYRSKAFGIEVRGLVKSQDTIQSVGTYQPALIENCKAPIGTPQQLIEDFYLEPMQTNVKTSVRRLNARFWESSYCRCR